MLGNTFFLTQTDLEAGFLLLKLIPPWGMSCLRFYMLHFITTHNTFFSSQTLYPTLLLTIVSVNTFPQHMWQSRKLLLSSTDLVKECYLSWSGSQRQKQWNNPAPPSSIYQGADLVSRRTIPHSVHVTKPQTVSVCQTLFQEWGRQPKSIDQIQSQYRSLLQWSHI